MNYIVIFIYFNYYEWRNTIIYWYVTFINIIYNKFKIDNSISYIVFNCSNLFFFKTFNVRKPINSFLCSSSSSSSSSSSTNRYYSFLIQKIH